MKARIKGDKLVTLHFDASITRNPGGDCFYGIVFSRNGTVFAEARGPIYDAHTNNEGEYGALIEGLKAAQSMGVEALHVKGDSDLIIKQMTGRWRVRANNLKDWYWKAKILSRSISYVFYEWVDRDFNVAADALAALAKEDRQERIQHFAPEGFLGSVVIASG